ncbi:MAG: hypothetical protein AMS27_09595 [Bacteroides sp. SM23_62_1]|nr:MAG: hypothetical protein AMS27_09595 [Bacteroides sp. SM23_62_1]
MKKINTFSILVIGMMMLAITACDDYWWDCLKGNGVIVSQEREFSHFSGIVSEGDFDVIIVIDSVYKAFVVADENLLPYIKTGIRNDNLVLNNSTRRCLRTSDNHPVQIFVHTPAVHFISLEGSGVIYCEDLIYVDQVRVELTGSGKIDLRDVDALELDALITGSGEIELWGVCEEGDLDIPGSGKIKAFHMEQDYCSANISGSGDMYVFVYDLLDANISGSGNIFYKGNPHLNIRISGSGSVINSNK